MGNSTRQLEQSAVPDESENVIEVGSRLVSARSSHIVVSPLRQRSGEGIDNIFVSPYMRKCEDTRRRHVGCRGNSKARGVGAARCR
jgi:hypothetical protein